MARNRASAKKAGAQFEIQVSNHLAENVDDRIVRRTLSGAKDLGDLANVRAHGQRVVVECKNTSRPNLSQWIKEAHIQAANDEAAVGIVVHKRHGVGTPGKQWVTMTVDDLVFLLTGKPQPTRYET